MGSVYERELRSALQADPGFIDWAQRVLPNDQAQDYSTIADAPFLVMRAAGSLGCDLVAMRRDVAFPIEVKAAKDKRIHFASRGGREAAQAQAFAELTATAGLIALYAFRLKGVRGQDPWRIFTLPVPEAQLQGRAALLSRRLPDIGESRSGNLVLRWDEGMPLHQFVSYLCSDVAPAPVAPTA